MRNILFLLLFAPAICIGQNDITQFIGIPFGSSKAEVKKALIAKGGTVGKTSDNLYYDVEFYSYKASYVIVHFTKTGQLSAGQVFIEAINEPQIMEFFLKISAELAQKYGEPIPERIFKSPYKYGDGQEYTAMKMGFAEVNDTWEKPSSGILLNVTSSGFTQKLGVMITYVTAKYIEDRNKNSDKDF